jgi:hypothetical protein
MATTNGFVGTIEVETRDVARIWFGLTGAPNEANWVTIPDSHFRYGSQPTRSGCHRRHAAKAADNGGYREFS